MPRAYRVVLTDTSSDVCDDEFFAVSSGDLETGCPHPWLVFRRRLSGGLSDGVEIVHINNGRLCLTVVPTRGMAIRQAECDGVRLGWDSPVRDLVHPKFVDLGRRGNLGWLDGFNEWLARCGLESNGVPGEDVVRDNQGNEQRIQLPLHGRIGNLPAHRLVVSVLLEKPWTISIVGEVRESSMFGASFLLESTLEVDPGSTVIRVRDTVRNLRAVESETQMLYHINYGSPLLEKGARLVLPVRELSPRDPRAAEGLGEYDRMPAPTPGFVEQCYFLRLGADRKGATSALLRSRDGSRGASITWPLKELPCFTVWKNTGAEADGYVTGLEPGTNHPNPRAFERSRGRVPRLAAGAARRFNLELAFHPTRREVSGVEKRIRAMSPKRPVVHERAHPDFSPAG